MDCCCFLFVFCCDFMGFSHTFAIQLTDFTITIAVDLETMAAISIIITVMETTETMATTMVITIVVAISATHAISTSEASIKEIINKMRIQPQFFHRRSNQRLSNLNQRPPRHLLLQLVEVSLKLIEC